MCMNLQGAQTFQRTLQVEQFACYAKVSNESLGLVRECRGSGHEGARDDLRTNYHTCALGVQEVHEFANSSKHIKLLKALLHSIQTTITPCRTGVCARARHAAFQAMLRETAMLVGNRG